jgi:hypothetical protein
MNPKQAIAPALLIALVSACYAEKTSQPATVAFNLDFPSATAAVLTSSVEVYVFSGDQTCTKLISDARSGESNLPQALFVSSSLSPCQIYDSQGNTFSLNSGTDYTMLAIGQGSNGKDSLIGCTIQPSFSNSAALSIPLTFINDTQSLGTTSCTKLSDKCRGAC